MSESPSTSPAPHFDGAALERFIAERLAARQGQPSPILLMTHLVIGYPSLEASLELVDAMVEAGVDLIELQIPFSEPIADGPVILHANQHALESGITVQHCLEFAERARLRAPVPLLFMSYYNVLFRRGVRQFVEDAARIGVSGAIVPDLPPEEGAEYLDAMKSAGLAPIFIYSPNTTDARLAIIAEHAKGFVYCVARKGVTGHDTEFGLELSAYLGRCRHATSLPLAVGFGVKSRQDVDSLIGKADIAVVGSATIRLVERSGTAAVVPFLRGLRG
jgi:tryptophan synthase alpha chain